MPNKFQHLLQNFAAGVLSPRYACSVDSEAFSKSLKTGKNFIISSQGGAVFREGYEFISHGISNEKFRIFQFHRGGDESDLLIEISAGTVRYWEEDATDTPNLIVDNVTILTDEDTGPPQDFLTDESGNFLTLGIITSPNPYALDELDTLSFTNQDKYGVICHAAHPPLFITRRKDGTILAELLAVSRIPEFTYNDVNSPQLVSEAGDWQVNFPASWLNSGFAYFMEYNGVVAGPTNQIYSFDPTDETTGTGNVNAVNIKAGLDAAIAKLGWTTQVTVTATDVLTYVVDFSGPNSGFPMAVTPSYGFTFIPLALPPLSQPLAGGDQAIEPAWSYPAMVLHNGRYYQCIQTHRVVAADDEPGVGTNWELYWKDLNVGKPVGFDYQYPNGNDWSATKPAPNESEANIYSPMGRGFPTVSVFHEQRSILMANPDNPTALYGSGIGEFFHYTPGPNDDQPFLFVLDSSDTPKIKWARSQNNLLLGTSSGEWSVKARVTITPTDIDAEQQNNARAHLTPPVQVDAEIFYVEQGLRKVRSTRFSDSFESHQSADISLLAEHLVSTDGVSRIVGSYIPEVMLTLLRASGQPLYFSYEKASPVIAFTEAETLGTVYDISAYFSLAANADHTYYAVQRSNGWMLERMRYPTSKADNIGVYLDSFVTGTVTGNTITGLEHLNGETVHILLDKAWQIGKYTVINGTVVLDKDHTGKAYEVGIPYSGHLETFEIPDNVRGTGLGTKRRWVKLYTRLLNSSLPKVDSELSRDRRPSVPMGDPDFFVEGLRDVEQSIQGFTDGSIRVTQDRPYPLYILGFFGEYQVEDR